MHPDPIARRTKYPPRPVQNEVRFPFSSCVITFSMPNQNKIAVKNNAQNSGKDNGWFFQLLGGRRSVTSQVNQSPFAACRVLQPLR